MIVNVSFLKFAFSNFSARMNFVPQPFHFDPPARDRPQIRLLRAIMRANAALRDAHKERMNELGVSLTEFDFLAALGNTDGLRMKDLARAMITTPSNVTRVCAAMEKKGLAVRERSAESDREVIARLTPVGEERFRELFPLVLEFSSRTIDELLTEDEQRTAGDILDRLFARLTD